MAKKEVKNNELKEKIDDIKEELAEKTKELGKEISEKTKDITEDLKEKTEDVLKNIKDSSKKFDKKDIEENKAMAALAYIIAPIPYFVNKESKWVHYHAVQGMNLFIIYIILSLAVSILNSLIFWPLSFIKVILRTVLSATGILFAIIGIVNVCNGEAKELPLINKFKIIKK